MKLANYEKGMMKLELKDVMEALTILLVIVFTFIFIIGWAKVKSKKRNKK
ncbi:hypothetical protein VQL36_06795 [Chengkuizengella sp. SCS-71B]